jgi:hypothetical protein
MVSKNSSIALAIDLVSHEYKTNNPLIIYEKVKKDLGVDITLTQITDYLELSSEDYQKESDFVSYYSLSNN